MTISLPDGAHHEFLRKQAKDVHKAHRRGDAACCSVLRRLKQFQDKADADILAAPVSLSEVQFALAMHYGFASWDQLKQHVAQAGAGEVSGRPLAGKTQWATLGAREYRIEWLSPRRLFDVAVMENGQERYGEACRALWGRLRYRPGSEDPYYGQHVWPLYNLHCDLVPWPMATQPEGNRWGEFWFELGRGLAGKVDWFALLAYANDELAGTIRFFPKTLTVPRFGGWSEADHRRQWSDDILGVGAAWVDPEGFADGLDSELVRRLAAHARAAGFVKIQALGWSEVRSYAAWGQALPASIYETQGFRTIAETPGCPDAFEHMLSGCHGERTKEVVTAELARTGLSPQAAARCRMMELDLTVPGRSPA